MLSLLRMASFFWAVLAAAQALRYNMVLDVPYIVVTNGRSTFGFERVPTGSEPLAGTPDGAGIPFRQMKSFPDWEKMQGQTAQTP